MRENRDQQNSEYGHFLRSDCSIKNTRLAIAMENIRSTGGYFLQKKKPQSYASTLFYNSSQVKFSSRQKHRGLAIDSKLSFNEYGNDKIYQVNKVSASIVNCE